MSTESRDHTSIGGSAVLSMPTKPARNDSEHRFHLPSLNAPVDYGGRVCCAPDDDVAVLASRSEPVGCANNRWNTVNSSHTLMTRQLHTASSTRQQPVSDAIPAPPVSSQTAMLYQLHPSAARQQCYTSSIRQQPDSYPSKQTYLCCTRILQSTAAQAQPPVSIGTRINIMAILSTGSLTEAATPASHKYVTLSWAPPAKQPSGSVTRQRTSASGINWYANKKPLLRAVCISVSACC